MCLPLTALPAPAHHSPPSPRPRRASRCRHSATTRLPPQPSRPRRASRRCLPGLARLSPSLDCLRPPPSIPTTPTCPDLCRPPHPLARLHATETPLSQQTLPLHAAGQSHYSLCSSIVPGSCCPDSLRVLFQVGCSLNKNHMFFSLPNQRRRELELVQILDLVGYVNELLLLQLLSDQLVWE